MTALVLSDTHGNLRTRVLEFAQRADVIIHAGDVGDVGDPDILEQLEGFAPVHAVRGNVDRGPWADGLPMSRVVEVGPHLVYVLHIIEDLDLDPNAAGFDAVVYGHSHRPENRRRGGVLYLNPGSCGPRSPWRKWSGSARGDLRPLARRGRRTRCRDIVEEVQRSPEAPNPRALRISAAWARFRCCSSSTMDKAAIASSRLGSEPMALETRTTRPPPWAPDVSICQLRWASSLPQTEASRQASTISWTPQARTPARSRNLARSGNTCRKECPLDGSQPSCRLFVISESAGQRRSNSQRVLD